MYSYIDCTTSPHLEVVFFESRFFTQGSDAHLTGDVISTGHGHFLCGRESGRERGRESGREIGRDSGRERYVNVIVLKSGQFKITSETTCSENSTVSYCDIVKTTISKNS